MTIATLNADNGNLDALSRRAADVAMQGAVNYLQAHGHLDRFRCDDSLISRLLAKIQDECRRTVDDALRDAREAVECGMTEIASVTFTASMKLAGIRAAKACVSELAVQAA